MTGSEFGRHDRPRFFKYVSSEALRLTLTNMNVLWQSPRNFNDPFDTQLSLRYSFSWDEYYERLLQLILDSAFHAEIPPEVRDPHLRGQLELVRQAQSIARNLSREEMESTLRASVPALVDTAQQVLSRKNEEWEAHLDTWRVFCVTEDDNNLLMWSHYASSHSGAMVEFRCIPELDNALLAAQPAIYSADLPCSGGIDTILLEPHSVARTEETYRKLILTKSAHWSYEREWRAVLPDEEQNADGRMFVNLRPEELGRIVFGCRMPSEKREELAILARSKAPAVRLFQARKSPDKFELQYSPLD